MRKDLLSPSHTKNVFFLPAVEGEEMQPPQLCQTECYCGVRRRVSQRLLLPPRQGEKGQSSRCWVCFGLQVHEELFKCLESVCYSASLSHPLWETRADVEMYCVVDSVRGLAVGLHWSETIKHLCMLDLLLFVKCFEILTHKISLLISARER